MEREAPSPPFPGGDRGRGSIGIRPSKGLVAPGTMPHVLRRLASMDEGAAPADEVMDCGGRIVAPGYVDLQINGAGGVMFNDTPDTATLACTAAAPAPTPDCCVLTAASGRVRLVAAHGAL